MKISLSMISLLGLLLLPACFGNGGKEAKEQGKEQGQLSTEQKTSVQQLRTGTEQEKVDAARQLGKSKATAPEALQALGGALRDPSPMVRQEAASSLAQIRTTQSMQELKQGWQQMQAKGEPGWEGMKGTYDQEVGRLRQEASQGNQDSQKMLDSLGEK